MMKTKKENRYANKELPQLFMGILGIFVGIIAGFGAVVFRAMIGLIHNVLFLGHFSFYYDANLHTPPSPWGWLIIFVPVIGAIGVVWLVKNFAPEAKGHGVPEVMDAIYLKEGKIRGVVAVVKSLASALSIGSGGSVGREGPIVQIGSAFGSILGRVITMPTRQRNILIAAGAAGGIAATFNTPVGALAFGVELMLTSVSASSLFVVAISTVTATYIGRAFLGVFPSFYIQALAIPNFHLIALSELAVFVPFGALVGLCSVVFIRGLYWCEDFFDAMPGNYYTRHILGMALMGVLIYLMMRFTGHYYVQGVGYATIVDILKGTLTNPWFLLLLVGAKLLATFLTLGSGASGGIFSPSLFLGATLGGAFGAILQHVFPGMHVSPIVFGMAGMAGMVGGTTGAVLTAITMVTEMTHDSNVALPIIITVGAAYIVRKLISNESVYTLKLLRRGSVVPEGLQSAVALAQRAGKVMSTAFRVVTVSDLEHSRASSHIYEDAQSPLTILADDHDGILGIFPPHITQGDISREHYDVYLDKRFVIVGVNDTLPSVMHLMNDQNADYAIVTALEKTHTHFKRIYQKSEKASQVLGIITEQEILASSRQAYRLL